LGSAASAEREPCSQGDHISHRHPCKSTYTRVSRALINDHNRIHQTVSISTVEWQTSMLNVYPGGCTGHTWLPPRGQGHLPGGGFLPEPQGQVTEAGQPWGCFGSHTPAGPGGFQLPSVSAFSLLPFAQLPASREATRRSPWGYRSPRLEFRSKGTCPWGDFQLNSCTYTVQCTTEFGFSFAAQAFSLLNLSSRPAFTTSRHQGGWCDTFPAATPHQQDLRLRTEQ